VADDSILWSKDGWRGYIHEYKGDSKVIGLLTLRCQKGARVMIIEKMTAEQIEAFDPEQHWRATNPKSRLGSK
jgi:hypothetical protein